MVAAQPRQHLSSARDLTGGSVVPPFDEVEEVSADLRQPGARDHRGQCRAGCAAEHQCISPRCAPPQHRRAAHVPPERRQEADARQCADRSDLDRTVARRSAAHQGLRPE